LEFEHTLEYLYTVCVCVFVQCIHLFLRKKYKWNMSCEQKKKKKKNIFLVTVFSIFSWDKYYQLRLLFWHYPKNGGSKLFWNTDNHLPLYTALYLRQPAVLTTLTWNETVHMVTKIMDPCVSINCGKKYNDIGSSSKSWFRGATSRTVVCHIVYTSIGPDLHIRTQPLIGTLNLNGLLLQQHV
jgi:hypothetical protein